MATVLSAHALELSYGYQKLLEGATIAIEAGEKVGLVGRNGCGKTSLLKILAGEESPDEGVVSLRSGTRVGILPQEFELAEERTVRENIEAGAGDVVKAISKYESGEGSETELSALQLFIEHADGCG